MIWNEIILPNVIAWFITLFLSRGRGPHTVVPTPVSGISRDATEMRDAAFVTTQRYSDASCDTKGGTWWDDPMERQ